MGPIWAMAIKDLRHLLRDKGAAFFALVFPLLVAFFFGAIFGGGGGGGTLRVILVDEDGSPASALFASDIAADAALRVTTVTDRDAAAAVVRRGDAVAAIIIPRGFSDQADQVFAGGSMQVEGVVDPARRAEAGLLTGKLNELAFRQMVRTFGDNEKMSKALDSARISITAATDLTPVQKGLFSVMFDAVGNLARGGATSQADGTNPLGSWNPVQVTLSEVTSERAVPTSAYQISFTQGIIWGLMGCVTTFGLSMAFERSRGTLLRLVVSPISMRHVLAGKALACFIACMAVQALLLAVGVLALGIRIDQPAMMLVAAVAAAFGFTGVMMLMAGMSRTEGGGAGMGRALILVLAMIGGGTVPLFVMPQYMQTASKISPFSWATIAMEGAMWRGFSMFEMAVPVGVLLGFGVVGFAAGAWCLRHRTL